MKRPGKILLIAALLAGFLWFGGKADYTYSERRPLAQMPELTGKSFWSGKFMPDFEDFTLDQFPLRDSFRKVKVLQAAFDPTKLHFSDEYYDVLGIERE